MATLNTTSPSPSDTREQIVRIARELMETRSYLGFSFQDIADRVGIRKPSLYHHFPSKDALAIEVLRRTTEAFERWSSALSGPAPKRLEAYFRMYRDGLRAGKAVCTAGALAPGWDCIEGELQQAVRALRSAQVQWLAGILVELGPPRRAPSRAAYVFALCQGAMLSARMTGEVADFDEAIAMGRRGLTL